MKVQATLGRFLGATIGIGCVVIAILAVVIAIAAVVRLAAVVL